MYDLTVKLAPCGAKPEEYLRRRTGEGLERIFGGNVPEFARERLENELEFIRRHCYGKYFCGLDYINSAVSRTPGAPRFWRVAPAPALLPCLPECKLSYLCSFGKKCDRFQIPADPLAGDCLFRGKTYVGNFAEFLAV